MSYTILTIPFNIKEKQDGAYLKEIEKKTKQIIKG